MFCYIYENTYNFYPIYKVYENYFASFEKQNEFTNFSLVPTSRKQYLFLNISSNSLYIEHTNR